MMLLFDAYKANKKAGGSRQDFLLKAAQIPGIYVPSLYDVAYKEDGTIASFVPNQEGVPAKVEKQLVIDMDHRLQQPGSTGGSSYQGDPGSCHSGDPAGLHPGLSFLSGRHDLPSYQRT